MYISHRGGGGGRSGGGDGDLHAGLAVTGDAADEVVGAAGERDAVVAGLVHLGAPRRGAAFVAGRVHRHHVVRRRVVLEHCTGTDNHHHQVQSSDHSLLKSQPMRICIH